MNSMVLWFHKHTKVIFDVFFLISILSLLFFLFLGIRPLTVPDEGNYAEITREMFNNKDFITPYLNGIKFFEKPVLLYWLGVMSFKWFGVNVWSLRFVTALFALLGCILTYFAGKILFSRLTGILAALILATSMLYFILAHIYTTDLIVSIFITATLYAFILSEKVSSPYKTIYLFCAAMFAGFAVLSKGLIGIVLPAFIIGIWVTLFNRWKMFNIKNIIIGSLIFLSIVLPWHIIISHDNPEFFKFYFLEHHLTRFSSAEVGHLRPFWYYIPVVILGLFPWMAFFPSSLKFTFSTWFKRHQYPFHWFFLLSSLSIFGFFSISKAKLIPYILPAFPAMALLIADYLVRCIKSNNNITIQNNYYFLFIMAGILSAGCFLFTHFYIVENKYLTQIYLNIAGIIMLLGAILGLFFSKKNILLALQTTILAGGLIGIILIRALPYMDRLTILPLTQTLNAVLLPNDIVVGFNHHYQDLGFYLQRKIYILNSIKLFSFGMNHQANHEWMINDIEFEKLWRSRKHVYAIMDIEYFNNILAKHSKYQHLNFYFWDKTSRNVLVANIPKG